MKNQLFALSLVLTSGLIADQAPNKNTYNTTKQQSNCCRDCFSNPCCCEPAPCCVPKEKKCIDCECYSPSYYDLDCSCGFFVSADFLYWYARETNLSYGVRMEGVLIDSANQNSEVGYAGRNYLSLDTEWDPGFRVGIGWNNDCSGWDYYLNWTYIHNKKHQDTHISSTYSLNSSELFLPDAGEEALLNPWVNPSAFPGSGDSAFSPITFDTLKAKWSMNLNWIDLELGRRYWTGACFNLRPYAGLRGLWNRVSFRTIGSRTDPTAAAATTSPLTFKDRFKTRMWGVGLMGGLQPAWHFCRSFAIIGNFDIALLWGEFKVDKKECYQDPSGISGRVINWKSGLGTNKFFQLSPMLDTSLGIRWEVDWCCEKYRSALDVLWEHHTLLDQNHRDKLVDYFAAGIGRQGTGFRTFDEATGNLDFGGLTIHLKVDF